MMAANVDIAERQKGISRLELYLVRHGQTPGNAERRYVGSKDDQPLSDDGRSQAQRAAQDYACYGFDAVTSVYVTNLKRTQETASIIFPNARQVVSEGIEEMDFGVFTGRSADEMVDDAQYRAWVDSYCEDICPGGESKAQFNARVCQGMETLLNDAARRGEKRVYIVAHGGTIMAFLSKYAVEKRGYYDWIVGNCDGYRMQITLAEGKPQADDVTLLRQKVAGVAPVSL